jgi:hypothetical protein
MIKSKLLCFLLSGLAAFTCSPLGARTLSGEDTRKTGTVSSAPPKEFSTSLIAWRHAPVPFALPLLSIQTNQQPPPAPGQIAGKLSIVVIEGENAVNNIRARTGKEAIVEVDDENHRPVAGAVVTFFVPNEGPGGSFAGNTQLLTVITDQSGRATATSFSPNNVVGQFKIEVTATAGNEVAKTIISQTNAASSATPATRTGASRGGMSTGKIALIVGVVAAAGLGAALGLAGHGSSSSGGGSSSQTVTISVGGTPTVGAAH